MQPLSLTPEQQHEAQAIYQKLLAIAPHRIHHMVELLASQSESEFFGKTEFELRELLHELGTDLLNTARDERKKGGTKVPLASAPPVTVTLDSNAMPRAR